MVMARRRFLLALTMTALAGLAGAQSQSNSAIRRIAFLSAFTRSDISREYQAFISAMRDLGYVEGKNLLIETRYADGDYEQLPRMAAELVSTKPEVIIAAPSPAIRAAQRATSVVPIVFPSTGDPVGSGFVATLARPGGNITGLSNSDVDLAPKTLELLKSVLPGLRTVGLLGNPGSSSEQAIRDRIVAAGTQLGIRVLRVSARNAAQIDEAFATLNRERAQAVVIANDAVMGMQKTQIAQLALKYQLASVSQGPGFARVGFLLGYGVDRTANYRRAAAYVDKIFRGSRPADLPVEQATTYHLVINVATAKALGLTLPASVMLRADEVID